MGLFIIIVFYNISSNFKNFYLELKSKYTSDDKYLAVITNNGLWIKDKINNKTLIINSSKIEPGFLIDTVLSEFDNDFEIIRSIQSDRIDITDNEWIVYNANIFVENNITRNERLIINSNFNYEKIQSLFSNLSSLSFLELYELKKNYKLLGYSTIELNVHIQKLISYPFYLLLMTIISTIIMFNSKELKNTNIKISIGLFSSVIIYYINNFFNVMGNTEKIPFVFSVWVPLLFLGFISVLMLRKINEK
jgi:lipopolysaccharide export system permease protein